MHPPVPQNAVNKKGKRGTVCTTSSFDGPEKTLIQEWKIAAHAIQRENHYAFFLYQFEISQVSKLQDKQNASFCF